MVEEYQTGKITTNTKKNFRNPLKKKNKKKKKKKKKYKQITDPLPCSRKASNPV